MRGACTLTFCLPTAAAGADWSPWTVAPGGAPGIFADGGRVLLLSPLPEGLALVAARTDGSEARSAAGPRSLRPGVVFTEDDLGRPAEITDAGAYAIVGNRLLISLAGPGAVDLAATAGEAAPLLDASISPDASCVALVTADGRLLATAHPWGPGFRTVAAEPLRSVALAAGPLALLGAEAGGYALLDLLTGSTLEELPEVDACAVSANGRRIAYTQGAALVRCEIGRSESAPVALPGPADAVVLDRWGGRVVVRVGERLLACTWAGDELRPVVQCGEDAAFALSAGGGAVAFASGGAVHVASFARGTPGEVAPLEIEAPRDLPAVLDPLPGLRGLAERIAAESAPADAAAGLVARDAISGWALYRHPEPPFSLRTPPGWTVEPTEEGVRLTSPEGATDLTVTAMRGTPLGPRAWLAERAPDAPQVPCLLGGAPGLSASSEREGRLELCYGARWADGIVLVAVVTEKPAPPDLVRWVVESLSLEPWGSAGQPPAGYPRATSTGLPDSAETSAARITRVASTPSAPVAASGTPSTKWSMKWRTLS